MVLDSTYRVRCATEVVRERGTKRLRRELLVGFDPVPLYAALLQQHFGHLAAFFYDGCGGRAIGIRCPLAGGCRLVIMNCSVLWQCLSPGGRNCDLGMVALMCHHELLKCQHLLLQVAPCCAAAESIQPCCRAHRPASRGHGSHSSATA